MIFKHCAVFQVRRGAKLRYASLTYPKGHPYPHDARSSSSPFQDLADWYKTTKIQPRSWFLKGNGFTRLPINERSFFIWIAHWGKKLFLFIKSRKLMKLICQKMLTFYLKTWFSKKCSHYNLIRLILPKNAHNQFWIHSILPKNAHNWIWIYIIFKNMLYVIFFSAKFQIFQKMWGFKF